MTTQQEHTDESILDHLSELKNYYQEEALASCEEFEVDRRVHYFTSEGFLYWKDPGSEKIGSFFNGYLTNDSWARRSSERFVTCSMSIVLACRCGEKLLLLGHEADWRREGHTVFECCGCGNKLSLRSE